MNEYAITFPGRFVEQTHPIYSAITPDHIYVVSAPNLRQATEFARHWFGLAYDSVIEFGESVLAQYPGGVLGRAELHEGLLEIIKATGLA